MIQSEDILDKKERLEIIRTSGVVVIEQCTLILLVGVLVLEGLICWLSWDYFVVFVLSVSFSIGAIQYVWQWKKASELQEKISSKKLELSKNIRRQKWSIWALIVLKSVVVLFFLRIFYFGIKSGISLLVFPIWQLLLPTANLLLVIGLILYLIITRQAIRTTDERRTTR